MTLKDWGILNEPVDNYDLPSVYLGVPKTFNFSYTTGKGLGEKKSKERTECTSVKSPCHVCTLSENELNGVYTEVGSSIDVLIILTPQHPCILTILTINIINIGV